MNGSQTQKEALSTDPVSRPILFSGPMVLAILDGRKTQTRRVVKDKPPFGENIKGTALFENGWHWLYGPTGRVCSPIGGGCRYGRVGDLLWVRECHSLLESSITGRAPDVWYWADGQPSEGDYTRPRPSIHMPRWASRITLRITAVRVERLNDISPDDAAAEGWPGRDEENTIASAYPIAWYARLWDQINGPRSYDSNPWVWVVKFERVADNVRAAA